MRACIAAGLSLIAVPAAASAQCPPALTIDTVVIETAGIADGGLAAALHVRTRPSVIRRTVLLHAGDCVEPARVAESERALWALGVFRAVRVDTSRLAPGGPLALRVTTADAWSAHPVLDYARAGSHTSWETGAFDGNFLGTAAQLFASYRSTPDRGTLAVQYYTPHLVVPGVVLWARHARLSNGKYTGWLVGLPFRETGARRSATLDGEAVEERVLVFGDPTFKPGPRARALRLRFNVGYAPLATSRGYIRLWVGARWRAESYAPTATDPYQTGITTTAGGGLELALVRFRTTRRLNTYGRPEYVDLSPTLRAGVWAAPQGWGYTADRAGVGGELRSRLGVAWRHGHAVAQLDSWGSWVKSTLDSGQARARLTLVTELGRHTAVVHGDAGRILGARPWALFDLWMEQRGPRLFPPHAFMGQRMWWALAEDRIVLSEAVMGLLGVGIAPFVEYASVRRQGGVAASGGNAGLALRVVPLRFAATGVTELALAYRFGSAAPQPGWAVGMRRGIVF